MSGGGLIVLGAVVVVALLAAVVVIVVSRRSHLRSWRFGVFYEAQDRYESETGKHEMFDTDDDR